MKLYILALDHSRKLKYIILVLSRVILCNVEEIKIFEHELFISALEHARILILNSYVLHASINTIYKYCHAWVI